MCVATKNKTTKKKVSHNEPSSRIVVKLLWSENSLYKFSLSTGCFTALHGNCHWRWCSTCMWFAEHPLNIKGLLLPRTPRRVTKAVGGTQRSHCCLRLCGLWSTELAELTSGGGAGVLHSPSPPSMADWRVCSSLCLGCKLITVCWWMCAVFWCPSARGTLFLFLFFLFVFKGFWKSFLLNL